MEQWLKYIGVFAIAFGLAFAYFYFKPDENCEAQWQEKVNSYEKEINQQKLLIESYKQRINDDIVAIDSLQTTIYDRNESLDSLKQEYEKQVDDVPNWNNNELTEYFTNRYE
jgi:uncharacterized protein HemX